mgnify:CR=1 FL=1
MSQPASNQECTSKAFGSTSIGSDACEVDLEASLVKNGGVVIQKSSGVGRYAVANRSFDVLYETIIREKPALVWQSENYSDYIRRYDAASPSTKEVILDMYHPPLSHPSSAKSNILGEYLCKSEDISHPVDLVCKLLVIAFSNAHEYWGYSGTVTCDSLTAYEQIGYDKRITASRSALFAYGSKISHSCDPNVTYTSKTPDGALEYKVVRPINSGDPVTFSYLGDIYQTPTEKRRTELQQRYSFLCECCRCTAPDFSRTAKCPGCQRYIVTHEESKAGCANWVWSCAECGPQKIIQQTEQDLEAQLHRAEIPNANAPPEFLQKVIDVSSRDLSPVHYITITALESLARLYASKASQQQMMEDMMFAMPLPRYFSEHHLYGASTSELRLRAAIAGLKAVGACECVAAGCSGCDNVYEQKHDPVYDKGGPMFHICMDLIEVPQAKRPSYSCSIVQRYLPLLRCMFGSEDPDVDKIEQLLVRSYGNAETAGTGNGGIRSHMKSTTGSARNKSRRSNKKKKRGKRK